MLAGRDLSASFPTDSAGSVLINHTAATFLGYSPEQALGKWVKNIQGDGLQRRIVGVVEDFHFSSLKEKIGPMVISPRRGLACGRDPSQTGQSSANSDQQYKNPICQCRARLSL